MIVRWSVLFLALMLLGMTVALSACADQPGSRAYGRYTDPGKPLQPYSEDYFKDHGT
jgi:hypothetical protein